MKPEEDWRKGSLCLKVCLTSSISPNYTVGPVKNIKLIMLLAFSPRLSWLQQHYNTATNPEEFRVLFAASGKHSGMGQVLCLYPSWVYSV